MPNSLLILWPVGALAALTFVMLAGILVTRIGAVRRREVSPRDFALGESKRVPARLTQISRNYASLLELPVLFYVICLLMIVTKTVSDVQLVLAWLFVAFRVVHTIIHVTINHILFRLFAFGSSVTVLVVMWVLFFVRLGSQ
ncbi:MAPEG family protein [Asticcacaulis sp. BYS171W]|uniref:MAPEG family protein n=1 Tax=Asticcacaulis aquaticus TaxID=2984212 RepID=A0ABT5HVH0_9CAUL|nr:MAPEG family protein [Asticcacaulis aquaticus]MDC7684058.1 MAPEG family protein [Asticcacaulis aquaticus]